MFYGFGSLDKKRGIPENRGFSYVAWSNMIRRCYDPIFPKRDAYVDCTIDESFREYHDFSEWACRQKGYGESGFNLDKDLLIKGNKHYSPENCVFVPAEINKIIMRNRVKRGLKHLPIGVSLSSRAQPNRPYLACLSKSGKKIFVGSYPTIEQAFYAYKQTKEAHIKKLAEKYRDLIDPRAYDALMAYQVEITD